MVSLLTNRQYVFWNENALLGVKISGIDIVWRALARTVFHQAKFPDLDKHPRTT